MREVFIHSFTAQVSMVRWRDTSPLPGVRAPVVKEVGLVPAHTELTVHREGGRQARRLIHSVIQVLTK